MNRINIILCFSLISAFLFVESVCAQNVVRKRKCGTDDIHKEYMQNKPGYALQYQQLQAFTDNFVAQHQVDLTQKTVITVPVVFHIVLDTTQMAAFSDSRIDEQITVLNQDYSGQNTHSMGSFSSTLKANTELQFCLAQVDPAGQPSSGITHLTSTHGAWGESADIKHTATGGVDQWDPNKYLNIWVCELGSSLCGYALYPTNPLSNEFGLVCHYEYVGLTGAVAPYDLGGTVSHEIGHCFNVQHIWGDAGGCSPDDACNDTPLQDIETYGAPSGVVTDTCTAAAPGIMYMNFMDYVDDIAYANFTPDQKTRIQACFSAGGSLFLLGQSTVCGPPPVAPVADFSGAPLTIPQGNAVTFTDASTNTPTSWVWTFPGGTPATYTGQTPPAIIYNTPGDYSVTLIVSNAAGVDTLIKNPYVHVVPLNTDMPVADFYAIQTTLPVGGSTDFVDISTGTPISWKWTFYGGTPSSSTLQNPTGITYSASGNYAVTLKAVNYNGSDTLRKTAYIHVSSDYLNKPVVAFAASARLITVGTTVNFTDQSTNNPTSWNWTFQINGVITTSATQQNPTITYNNTGIFDVKLKVANPLGADSLTKTDYIVVTNDYMPNVCDTIRNVGKTEPQYFWHISATGGYVPGQNSDNVKAYADKYVDYEHNQITTLLVPVKIAKAASSGTLIKFKVWGATSLGLPDETHVLGYKYIQLNTMQSGWYKYVHFDSPIGINGIFFVGYEVAYAAGDTFVCSMAINRGINGINTMFVKKSNNAWVPAYDVYSNLHTSLGITPAVCLVNSVDIIEEENLLIFPNPSHDIFNIEVQDDNWNDVEIKVFDMLGKLVKVSAENPAPHLFHVDLNNQQTGIYFLNIKQGNRVVTKKISVIK